MKVLLGASMYLLDIPVVLWLYYRCLEKENGIWRRGKYPLLILHGAAGLFGCLNYLGIGPEGFFYACWILTLLLAEEFAFLVGILWGEKGMQAIGKSFIFILLFRGLVLGGTAFLEKVFMGRLRRLPINQDYLPVLGAAVLLTVLVFLLEAWILSWNLYEKLPKLLRKGLSFLLALGLTGLGLFLLDQSEWDGFLLAAAACYFSGGGLVLLNAQQRRIRGERYYFRQQKRVLEDYSLALERQNLMIRQLSQDVNTHLSVMKRLALTGREKEMDEAAWRLQQEYGKLAFVEYSSNRAVNALLQRKLELCRARKIRVQVDLAQFDSGFVENTDWLGIFITLFDNAVDACLDMEPGRHRFIRVKAKCAYGFEVIVFQNSRQPGRRSKNGRKTTKGSAYEYGEGLYMLEKIVEKYGGNVICQEGADTFQTTISLQIKERQKL